jgi:cardiolipin synthase A/B
MRRLSFQYRDFATTNSDPQILSELEQLFENDWTYSAEVGQQPASFNPTSRISGKNLIISPVNSADRLVRLYQKAERTLDVYTELLGNLTLESELFAAVKRGVRVRLISPVQVNGATSEMQQLQTDSLQALAGAGVDVHVAVRWRARNYLTCMPGQPWQTVRSLTSARSAFPRIRLLSTGKWA